MKKCRECLGDLWLIRDREWVKTYLYDYYCTNPSCSNFYRPSKITTGQFLSEEGKSLTA